MRRARAARKPTLAVESMEPREAPSCLQVPFAPPAGHRHRPAQIGRIGRIGQAPARPLGISNRTAAMLANEFIQAVANATSNVQQATQALQAQGGVLTPSQVESAVDAVQSVQADAQQLAQQLSRYLGRNPSALDAIEAQVTAFGNAMQGLANASDDDELEDAAETAIDIVLLF